MVYRGSLRYFKSFQGISSL